MIDLEINRAVYGFSRGIEINEETINIDLINEIGFGEKDNYLSSKQTLEHFKEILWDTELFDTSYRKNEFYTPGDMDEDILEKLMQSGKDLYLQKNKIDIDPGYKKKIDKIIESARDELLYL